MTTLADRQTDSRMGQLGEDVVLWLLLARQWLVDWCSTHLQWYLVLQCADGHTCIGDTHCTQLYVFQRKAYKYN